MVVVSAGLRQLFRRGENRVRASSVLMAIQGGIVGWNSGSAPYDGVNPSALPASRTEELAGSEAGEWAAARRFASQTPVPGPPVTGG
ncbi:hypothetical protein J3S85_04390 [Streptomyces lavenduligriseus]|nr:hypothetical protein J3S85_04390 [Streptomyces lavenduligriseus]